MPGLLVGRLHMSTAPLIPAAAVPGVPAELERPLVPLLDWPEDREPSFLAWLDYAGDTALTSWVQERFILPEPHVVYLRRCGASNTFYIGITRASRGDARAKEHDRAARRLMRTRPEDRMGEDDELRAYALDAWEAFDMVHGADRTEHSILVPGKVCALLAEVMWTCLVAAAGYKVFGHWLGDLCPAKARLERPPSWARNTVVPVRSPVHVNAWPGALPA